MRADALAVLPQQITALSLSDLPTEMRVCHLRSISSKPGVRPLFKEDADIHYNSVHFPAALAQTSKFFHVDVAEHYDFVYCK